MRKLLGALFVIAIAVVLITIAGRLLPDGSLLSDISDGIRDVVGAIGDSITGAVRGVG